MTSPGQALPPGRTPLPRLTPLPWQILRKAVADRPTAPFVTWYGSTGDRVELSALSYANGVAKTVGFLRDDLMLEPGEVVSLRLGLHWQTSIWIQACAVVGLVAELQSDSEINSGAQAAVAFDMEMLVGSEAPNKVIVSTHPLGLPGPSLPERFIDHARQAMGQPDVLPDDADAESASFLLHDTSSLAGRNSLADKSSLAETRGRWSLPEISAATHSASSRWGITAGQGVLTSCSPTRSDGWLAAWAYPLLCGGHAVLAEPGVDLARIEKIEDVTPIDHE